MVSLSEIGGAVIGMSKAQQAVDLLQDMIEQGDLAPGSMVSENKLVEMTGLGRTPIREAIQRLALSHMIRIHPSRGLEIPAITVEDQLSSLEVRRSLEPLAVELACARANGDQRAAMRDLAGRLGGSFTLPEYGVTVRATHAMIIEAARNPFLGAAMLPLQTLSRRFWIMHAHDRRHEIRRGGDLHRAMLSAIAARNIEHARAASLALNDYLVQFTLEVVSRRAEQSVRR